MVIGGDDGNASFTVASQYHNTESEAMPAALFNTRCDFLSKHNSQEEGRGALITATKKRDETTQKAYSLCPTCTAGHQEF